MFRLSNGARPYAASNGLQSISSPTASSKPKHLDQVPAHKITLYRKEQVNFVAQYACKQGLTPLDTLLVHLLYPQNTNKDSLEFEGRSMHFHYLK